MMSVAGYTQDGRIGILTTDLGKDVLLLRRMTAVERLSESFTIVVDAWSPNPAKLHTLLGTNATIQFLSEDRTDLNRYFNGQVWEYTELDSTDGYNWRLTLRPTTEFSTLNRRSKVWQNKSVKDMVIAVLGESSTTHSMKSSATYAAVEYTVQYQESDFDFISRLMEYEGLYYYYTHSDGAHEIVLIDDRNAHEDMTPASLLVEPRDERNHSYIWSVVERRGLGPAKVTVDDYDFEQPKTALLKSKPAATPGGTAPERFDNAGSYAGPSLAEAEVYDFPSKYNKPGEALSTRYSENWLGAHRRQMARSFAEGDAFSAAVGRNIKLKFFAHEASPTESDYLIVGTTHRYAGPDYTSSAEQAEDLTVELELMPAADQYRPALRTPRPRILGPQTALVVGPSGEEIYTDKYGRIKVQFHWDRDGAEDDKSSCFVRVVQTGAGKNWGSFSLPRMGQEVVVEFMDGDPDRPIVTGAVYNGENGTPVLLPDNKTQFGWRSRSTKGGGGTNHLWVEDKKGEEVVWFRAERDYKMHIVNADEERQYDKGNRKVTFQEGNDELIITKGTRTETIEGHDTKTIKTGNRIVAINTGNLETTVKTGDETRTVKTGKRTTTIQQDETLEVKMGNRDTAIKMGNDTLDIKMGNRKTELSMGNDALTLKMGNVDIKLNLGAHKTDAMQAIELKCGMSSIKLTPASIEIKSLMVKVEATAILETKGLMTQHNGTAMTMIKGGLVMIN